MLYWHLGMKRTGTTSLQTVLVAHQADLAEAGLVYPEEWRSEDPVGYPTHDGLTKVIETSDRESPSVRHFREYLGAHVGSSILLSSEFVSDPLADSPDAVLRTLSLAQSIMPVTCIWTLRRLDEQVSSLCLRRALLGMDFVFPGEADVGRIGAQFAAVLAGMSAVEDLVGGRVTYVKYQRDGSHNGEILAAVQMPRDLRRTVEGALGRSPRLNPQVTYKGAVAMCHTAELAERCGTTINGLELRRALFLGNLEFTDDMPCELMGDEVRHALHDAGLAAASRHGIDDYIAFFEGDSIPSRPPVELDPDALSDEDLELLVSHLDRPRA